MNVSRRQFTAYVINFRYLQKYYGISMPQWLLSRSVSLSSLLNDKTFVMHLMRLSVVHRLRLQKPYRNGVILCDTFAICSLPFIRGPQKAWNAKMCSTL